MARRGCSCAATLAAIPATCSTSDVVADCSTVAGRTAARLRHRARNGVRVKATTLRSRRASSARELWHAARDPRGTLAEVYLRLRRLTLDDTIAGKALRFHPRLPWWNESAGRIEFVPALIAAFRSLDDDEITAVHRIALKPDGHKLGKRMLGVVHRAAVKLDADIGGELAIGEGIETCLAARMFGVVPAWALGSAGGVKHFPVLPDVQTLWLIGESDRVNAEASECCGQRWRAAGRRVRVIPPPHDCKDLNDALFLGRQP